MTKQEVIESIKAGKLLTKRDWSKDVLGLFSLFTFWLISAIVLVAPAADAGLAELLFFLLTGGLFWYGIYCLFKENDLTKLETGVETATNRQLVVSAFKALNWTLDETTKYVLSAYIDNSYGFISQKVTALIEDKHIYLNVKHNSTFKGRMPFFFGLNQKRLNQICEKINGMHLTLATTGQRPASPHTQA